jgi:hypothetical protein
LKAHRYDITLKSIFNKIPKKFLKYYTGYEKGELIDTELPEVSSRRADLVIKLPNNKIFHLEIQTQNDPDMAYRMADYYLRIHKRYNLDIIQMVLYIGSERLSMKNGLELNNLAFKYRIVDIRDMDCRELLESDSIEDNLLSILCKIEDERLVLRDIVNRINKLESETEKRDYLLKLFHLASAS